MSALTSLLVRDGVVPVRKIEEALQRQVMSGGDLETVLLEMNALPENILSAYRAAVFGVRPASREAVMSVDPDVIALVPSDVAIEQRMIPLRVEGRTLSVAVHEPLGSDDVERLGFLLGFEIVSELACEVRIAAALTEYYDAELAPRMVRLVGKVHGRAAGPLPEVEAQSGQLGGHLADLPDKSSLDEASVRPRYTRSGNMILEPALPESEPPPHADAEPASSRRHTIRAPAMGTERPPAQVIPRLTDPGVGPPSEPPPSAAALRRHRGPITLAAGERMLRQSPDRDHILAVFFAFARQFFDYTALFVVSDDVADGREAWGVGASTAEVRALSIPLEEPGAFCEAKRTLAPVVRRLDQTEADRDVALGLRRTDSPTAMVMPVAIRRRPVLILYGDRDGEEFDIGGAMELVRFGSRVVEAFEQLIIRKKRAGYVATSDAAPAQREQERAALKVSGRPAEMRIPAQPTQIDRVSWQPTGRSGPGFQPDSSTSDDSWGAVTSAPGIVEAPTEATAPPTDRPPPPEPAPEPQSAGPRKPRRNPSDILGIPRRAPPPPATPDLDVGGSDLDDEEDVEQYFGGEDEVEVAMTVDVDDEDFDVDDPEVDADDGGEPSDPASIEAPAEEAAEPEPPPERDDEEDRRDTDRPPPPRSVSTYSIKGAPVDVIRTGRRGSDRAPARAPSDRSPARAPSDRSPARAPSDRSPARAPSDRSPPRRSSGRPDAADSDPPRLDGRTPPERPAARSSPPRDRDTRSEPPIGMDVSTRSVIVDMGHQVHAQVNDLIGATTDEEQEHLCEGLLAIGEAALPVLAQAFPGPLRWKRERRGKVPPAADISPIMRAMVTFGSRAASYVAALLSSAHPDVRFYAAVVASEIVAPELMDSVAERIHDEDKGVRRIAVQLMPRFAGFRGFAEIRTVIRRTARLRGKDPRRREHAIDAVAELRDVEMIPKLIELLREHDAELVKHVHGALVKITSHDVGRSHKKWEAWWDAHRGNHRIEWLIDSIVHSDEPLRRQAGEELKRLTQEYYGYHAGSPKRDRKLIANKYRQWWRAEGQRRFA